MNDAEREEIMRRGVAAWNDGDIEALVELCEPGIEMRLAGAFLGLEREYHGHGGLRAFEPAFREMWERIEVGVDGFEHFGSTPLADLHFFGTGRDGVEVDMSFYACCQIPERLIRVWANFTERELAVEAARELAGAASGGSA